MSSQVMPNQARPNFHKIFLVCTALAPCILLRPGFAGAQVANAVQPSAAQPSTGTPEPINITASQGIEWRQAQEEVIASGNAKAVRGTVTVLADKLVAHYRKKSGPAVAVASAPAAGTVADPEDILDNGGDTEIYQIDAVGHVHIYTATDNAYGDLAVYNMDVAALVLVGSHLKLTTPTDVITARDSIEYYSVKRMAVARGNALIVANDGRSIAADVLVGYLAPPPATPAATPATASTPASPANPPDMLEQGGKLQKVDAIGHVVIHTADEMATGDKGVYLPDQGLARLGGNVHVIRGPNQMNGADALINTKTGVATLLAGPGGQVVGTVVPNSGSKP
jgi:lipopolysaccharide export system protein LptA